MNICVFDTETVSVAKKFCYNVGYQIIDTDTKLVQTSRDYVVEQVWHNTALFSTAYYADKRPIYVSAMRGRSITMEKWGYICQQMIRDFKAYEVKYAYAYHSAFDEETFNFNCDWFKTINPFDDVQIRDIRGFVHNFLITDEFKAFCDENALYTDAGHYSTTAETVYKFISGETEFKEAHTALADAVIESDILLRCVDLGADLTTTYPTKSSIKRKVEKPFRVEKDGKVLLTTTYSSFLLNKERSVLKLKG